MILRININIIYIIYLGSSGHQELC